MWGGGGGVFGVAELVLVLFVRVDFSLTFYAISGGGLQPKQKQCALN